MHVHLQRKEERDTSEKHFEPKGSTYIQNDGMEAGKPNIPNWAKPIQYLFRYVVVYISSSSGEMKGSSI